MKSNTQTILYIIVIIASLFFSFIKKKKEKEKRNTVPGKQKKQFSSSIFSSLLGNDFDLEEISSDEAYIEKEPEAINKPEKRKININKNIVKKTPEEEDKSQYFNVLEDFDLPQAIVYSEILKKKEF
ncbi:MAG: hypothetical protein IMY72_02865 [Bacteroidetes bacterium]|nr:hypothetical protein [Bacteroidota bacterium]